jgi:cysteine desulfuration protein SufE
MTINEIQDQIIKECSGFKDWTDRYNYLIQRGRELPEMSSDYKTDDNLIRGCQVKAWFSSELKENKIYYQIDSDSLVVRGIIFLLLRVFSGQSPEDIEKASLYFIDQIGLADNFVPTDPSNLEKIFLKIKEKAEQYAQ